MKGPVYNFFIIIQLVIVKTKTLLNELRLLNNVRPMDTKMYQHLVFYDGACGFCDCSVRFLMRIDKKQLFAFAPLQGETAAKMLTSVHPQYKNLDTLILIENYWENPKIYLEAKAVFRICWLLGGGWSLLGLLSFLPSFLMNWGYRLVARNRYLFGLKTTSCPVPPKGQEKRFLP